MKKSAIREKSIKGENWQLVKRKVVWCEISNVPLCCVSSLLGEGGLEVCGYGHRQDISLDVCPSVYTRICGTLSSSLAGWNDLESHLWRKGSPRTLTVRHAVLYCKKKEWFIIYLFILYLLQELQVTLLAVAPGYLKVTHGETRWNIYHWFQWEYKFFMRAKRPTAKISFRNTPFWHWAVQLKLSS